MKKWLICLIAIGLLASLVQIGYRHQSEKSNKQYEIAVDFRDLIYVSTQKPNQVEYLNNQLIKLKKDGITTICISESSLDELEQLQRIDVFSAKELSFLTRDSSFDPGFTYLIFKDVKAIPYLSKQIRLSYKRMKVDVDDWEFEGKKGLRISLPQGFAQKITLLPDELSMQRISELGFRMILRVSNRIDYNATYNQNLFELAATHEVRRLFFDGTSVPGYDEEDKDLSETNLRKVSSQMRELNLGMAIVELLKYEPKGLKIVAEEINNDVIRIHSITERDAMMESEIISARMALAVKDRNIRMIFLNVSLLFAHDRNKIVDTLADGNLMEAVNGEHGAIQKLSRTGFEAGKAEPFKLKEPPLALLLKILIIFGCIALILQFTTYFFPNSVRLFALIALVFSTPLFFFAQSILLKILALGVAISAPTMAVLFIIRKFKDSTPSISRAIRLFIIACFGSLMGAIFVPGLLYGEAFMVVLDQFAGVSLLHLLPIVLVAFYVVFYDQKKDVKDRIEFAKNFMHQPIKVFWVLLAGFAGVLVMYYLSRTGNSGETIDIELIVRNFLEDTLGVRPRNKEFLFAHPLFIFASFLAFRFRQATLLFLFAVMGQLSIVSSFTHLHTPLFVSLLRVIYGMAGGILFGLLLILIWNMASKGWRKWLLTLKKS
jgi:hypothetical protein